MGEIVSLERFTALRSRLRKAHQALVLTDGCFDLLHPGHLSLLEQAKAMGQVLLVAVNSDASACAQKGPGRPIQNEKERAELLAALSYVDYVLLSDDATAERLVDTLKPEIYVKGNDDLPLTPTGEPPEAEALARYGGALVILPCLPGHSTTALIQRVLERCGATTPPRKKPSPKRKDSRR